MLEHYQLAEALRKLARYRGGTPSDDEKKSLVLVIVSVSEALRFNNIVEGISDMLKGQNTYAPLKSMVNSWGGKYLGTIWTPPKPNDRR